MDKDPLFESALARTSRDFFDAFHSYGWCSFGLGFVAIIWEGYMIIAPLYFIPANSTTLAIGWIQAITFTGGMAILLIVVFLVCGLFTPYKQRNEARALLLAKPEPAPLRNRESLIRAIVAVKEKAIAVKMSHDRFNFKEKRQEDSRKEWLALTDAHLAYFDATKGLETERLVAGDYFKGIVLGWLSFVNYHVDDCMGNIVFENKHELLKTIPFMKAEIAD